MSINEEIEQLEKEKMEYLEVNDKRTANKIENKIYQLCKQQELEELRHLKNIKEELIQYKKFIKHKGLKKEFEDWNMTEYILKCVREKEE